MIRDKEWTLVRMKMLVSLLTVGLLAGMTFNASADEIRFVDASASPGGDGLSWDTAYTELFLALDDAATDGTICEIWVADGTYSPDRGGGDRSQSFDLVDGVVVLGGFSGGEASQDQRDPSRNIAILTGDFNGDDDSGFRNRSDNARHVVSIRGSRSALLDGFIIRGGNADFDPDQLLGGGGVFVDAGAMLELRDCTLRENSGGRQGNNIGGFGGAIFVQNAAATIVDCTFRDNRSDNGGAIGFRGGGELVVESSVIEGNRAFGIGGAMWSAGNNTTGTVIYRDCTIADNFGEHCGGLFGVNLGRLVLRDTTLLRNVTDGFAGAVWFDRCDGDNGATPAEIVNCDFIENRCQFLAGAAYYNETATRTVNCRFIGNLAEFPGDDEGRGGAVVSDFKPQVFVNCLFNGNRAQLIGGVWLFRRTHRLVNCTFVNNESILGIIDVECLFVDQSPDLAIDNCIFWRNGGTEQIDQLRIDDSTFRVNFNLIQGLTGELGGEGNIDANPEFLDFDGPDGAPGTLDDDLRLTAESPARGAASNDALPEDNVDLDRDGDRTERLPLDLALAPRVDGEIVDMGALEFQSETGSTAELTEFTIVTGDLLGGELDDLRQSDDSHLQIRSGFGDSLVDLHNMTLDLSAVTVVDAPSTLDVAIESRIDEPSGSGFLLLRNWSTSEFDQVGAYAVGETENVARIENIDATNYVNESKGGAIELRMKHVVFAPFLAFSFDNSIDLVEAVVR